MSAKQLIVLATVATVAMASAATAAAKPPDLSTARAATAGHTEERSSVSTPARDERSTASWSAVSSRMAASQEPHVPA